MKNAKLNIEKYIKKFEIGLISVEEIAMIEQKNEGVVYRAIKRYYSGKGEPMPKVLTSTYLIKEYMKEGLSRKQIEEVAFKKNIIIADIYYTRAEKELQENEIKTNGR